MWTSCPLSFETRLSVESAVQEWDPPHRPETGSAMAPSHARPPGATVPSEMTLIMTFSPSIKAGGLMLALVGSRLVGIIDLHQAYASAVIFSGDDGGICAGLKRNDEARFVGILEAETKGGKLRRGDGIVLPVVVCHDEGAI